jgi:hypothetical protein
VKTTPDMKLTVMGFGILGLFMMGCGLLEPSTPVGVTKTTSATITDSTPADALLPLARPTVKADTTDPWGPGNLDMPSWKADPSDPWAPPAAAAPAAPALAGPAN